MSKLDELVFLDATAQADLVRRGEVRPIELVEAAIERIQRVNPEINAMVTPMYEQGQQAARNGPPEGSFTGVPFLLKDILASYQGVRLSLGTSLLKNFIAGHVRAPVPEP